MDIRSFSRTAALLLLLAACREGPGTAPEPVTTPEPVPEAVAARTGPRRVEGYLLPGERRTGFITGRDGAALAIAYEIHDGLAIWDGDIILGPPDGIATTEAELRQRLRGGVDGTQGVVINGIGFRWPGGVVPYEIDPDLPNPDRALVAMEIVDRATPGVVFVPHGSQTNYVRFAPGTGCSSQVGMVGGMQLIILESDCDGGNTAHEVLHALGMHHEHTRCDRNTFVQINFENIESGKEDNFFRNCDAATDLYEYDERSMMHYPPDAFSKNDLPTITSLRGLADLMGQRLAPSASDALTISDLYGAFNDPPVAVITGLAASYPEGTPIAFDGSNSSDPDDTHLDYKWAFRDGICEAQNPPLACSQAVTSHTYADDAAYEVILRVSDGFRSDDATALANVLNVAPVVLAGPDETIDEGSLFTRIGAFEDPGADEWSATVDYDDGMGTKALALTGKGFQLEHRYPDDGAHTVRIEVVDDDAGTGADAVDVTVENVVPDVDAGADATVKSAQTFELSGAFSDPGLFDAPWSWTINWGDRTNVSGVVNTQSASIVASHQVCAAGEYDVTLSVPDKDGGVGSDALTLTVPYVAVELLVAPGGDPNAVSLTRKGVLPVAVLGSSDIAAADIDPATVVLGDEDGTDSPVAMQNNGRWRAALEDVNRDGYEDLVLMFDVQTLVANGDLDASSTRVILRGFLADGCTNYRGEGSVSVRPST